MKNKKQCSPFVLEEEKIENEQNKKEKKKEKERKVNENTRN